MFDGGEQKGRINNGHWNTLCDLSASTEITEGEQKKHLFSDNFRVTGPVPNGALSPLPNPVEEKSVVKLVKVHS